MKPEGETHIMSMDIQELQMVIEQINGMKQKITKKQQRRKKTLKNVEKWLERMEQKLYKDQSRTIRRNEKHNKKMTSFAIHTKNQKIIQELQDEATLDGFFLSKENIINMGLQSLHKEVSRNGTSIHDLFLKYK